MIFQLQCLFRVLGARGPGPARGAPMDAMRAMVRFLALVVLEPGIGNKSGFGA